MWKEVVFFGLLSCHSRITGVGAIDHLFELDQEPQLRCSPLVIAFAIPRISLLFSQMPFLGVLLPCSWWRDTLLQQNKTRHDKTGSPILSDDCIYFFTFNLLTVVFHNLTTFIWLNIHMIELSDTFAKIDISEINNKDLLQSCQENYCLPIFVTPPPSLNARF